MFQTYVLENIRTHFMFNIVPFMSNVKKYGRSRQATDENTYNSLQKMCDLDAG
jgi:hypothetical protein